MLASKLLKGAVKIVTSPTTVQAASSLILPKTTPPKQLVAKDEEQRKKAELINCKPLKVPGTRQNALEVTAKFQEGTVGYGVHASIKAIFTGLGEFGAAKIGQLFSRPDVQALLNKESNHANDLAVAEIEYAYWYSVLKDAKQWNDFWGGLMGTRVPPEARVVIQHRMAGLRGNINKLKSHFD